MIKFFGVHEYIILPSIVVRYCGIWEVVFDTNVFQNKSYKGPITQGYKPMMRECKLVNNLVVNLINTITSVKLTKR